MKYYIPLTLNIDTLIEGHPPSNINGFDRDDLIKLLGEIINVYALSEDVKTLHGFVPVKASLLQRKINNYKQYIDYLIAADVLLCDNIYIVGEKCKAYRITHRCSTGIKSVNLKNNRTSKSGLKNLKGITLKDRNRYKHILGFFNSNLEIDFELAKQYIEEDLILKLDNSLSSDTVAPAEKIKDPYRQYISAFIEIDKISDCNFSLSIDDTGNRLHTNLTKLSSPLRNLITYKGDRLVSVDVKNCQPYLSSRLLTLDFWANKKDGTDGVNAANILTKTLLQKFLSSLEYKEFERICSSGLHDHGSDLHVYKRMSESGVFYEHMQMAVTENTGKVFRNRKAVKEMIFQVLFTDNRFIGQPEAEPKRLFKSQFPTVYKLFSLIKRKDKKLLPILLQRIESYLVLDIICKRISKERPSLPIFTIHDSIVTIQGEEKYIETIMIEELTKHIGFSPAINIENWSAEYLKLSDGNIFIKKTNCAVLPVALQFSKTG